VRRRDFLKSLLILPLVTVAAKISAIPKIEIKRSKRWRIFLQKSLVAGLPFYSLYLVEDKLRVGDHLRLVREPNNRYDAKAVEIYWRDYKLGYLPRDENAIVSRILDRGGNLTARITDLRDWYFEKDVELEIWLEV